MGQRAWELCLEGGMESAWGRGYLESLGGLPKEYREPLEHKKILRAGHWVSTPMEYREWVSATGETKIQGKDSSRGQLSAHSTSDTRCVGFAHQAIL